MVANQMCHHGPQGTQFWFFFFLGQIWSTIEVGIEILGQPMRCATMDPKGPIFFFLGDRVESVGFFWIFVVPNVFTSTSQWVLNVFLKVLIMFPNIFPITSHILLTFNKFYSCSIYIIRSPKRVDYNVFMLG